MPQVILFDWDETLAHTRSAVVDAMEYVLKKYGKEPWEIVKTKYRDTTKSLKENFPNFFQDNADKAYKEYLKYYKNHGYGKVKPLEDAAAFLRLCQSKNIEIYIISNKEKSLLLKEVSFCFPDIKFSGILGNGDAPHNKPAPDPVFTALKGAKYAIDKNNVWLIGDSKQDTECACAAHIQPVLLGKGKFMDDEYLHKNKEILLVFNSFAELITYVKSLRPRA